MESKLKHLEFIQSTINRLNNNSFMIKGWCIALVSAIFALAAKDSNSNFFLLTYLAIPIFWFLDGYYLSQERKFRELYKIVSVKNQSEIDFSMENREHTSSSLQTSILSITLISFYLPLTLLILLIVIMM